MSYNQIESPFAPDLTNLDPSDTLTDSQDVPKILSPAETASLRSTIQRCMVYIMRTKQVINALHEHIELLTQLKMQQRNLLKHCLTQLENPRARNQDLIINAIKQHLGEQ